MNASAFSDLLGKLPVDMLADAFPNAQRFQQTAVKSADYTPKSEYSAIGRQSGERAPRWTIAAVLAACLLFAVGFGAVMLHGNQDDLIPQNSQVDSFLEEVTAATTSDQTAAALSEAETATSAQTLLHVTVTTSAQVSAVTEPETQPEETALPSVNSQTDLQHENAALDETDTTALTTESETDVPAVTTTHDNIPVIDIPEDSAYQVYSHFAEDGAPQMKEVRISAAPEAVFVISEDENGESVSVRYGSETQLLCQGVYLSHCIFADISGDGVPELCMTAYTVSQMIMDTVVYETTEQKRYTIGTSGDPDKGGWEMFEVGVDSSRLAGIRRTYYPPEDRTVHDNSKAYGTFRIMDGVLYFIEYRTGTRYH